MLLYLAPEVACHDAEAADQLRQAHAEFSRRPPGAEVEESARTVALETARRLGRKLVLMVENCQSLFDDVDDRFGWGLRKTLQTEPNVMFLGTATVRMAALTDVEAPFYEFFFGKEDSRAACSEFERTTRTSRFLRKRLEIHLRQ